MMKIISLSLFILILISCGDNKYEAKNPHDIETMNSGKLNVIVDNAVKSVIDTGLVLYEKDYKKVLLTKEFKNARETMGQLLSGNSRVVVIARDYLQDEDSLMKEFKVKEHEKMKIATDALVLFCRKDYPIDTLNINQVEEIFQNGKRLSDMFKTESKVNYYINDVNSSVYSNFKKMILDNKPLGTKVNYINDNDSLKNMVYEDKGGIGISYLSQILGDERFKMIEIGYYDSTGVYERPKPVHQAYIVQGKYPYPVDIWVYLLEDRRNLPFWFASYLAKEKKYLEVVLKMGIVPDFARFQLVPEKK